MSKDKFAGRDIFLCEFWGLVHEAEENGQEPPFSSQAITFVESALMTEPVLTDSAKAILYYMQSHYKENHNYCTVKEIANFLHTTGRSITPSMIILARYNLVYHSYVGKEKISGYCLTERGRRYNPLGKDKNINDIILNIIE